jgi:hypothetical protein
VIFHIPAGATCTNTEPETEPPGVTGNDATSTIPPAPPPPPVPPPPYAPPATNNTLTAEMTCMVLNK